MLNLFVTSTSFTELSREPVWKIFPLIKEAPWTMKMRLEMRMMRVDERMVRGGERMVRGGEIT